jgi:predicted amidohydrolase
VLPEAAVSGYDDALSGLDRIDPQGVDAAIDRVAELACERGLHVFAGSLRREQGTWRNAALYLAPDGSGRSTGRSTWPPTSGAGSRPDPCCRSCRCS